MSRFLHNAGLAIVVAAALLSACSTDVSSPGGAAAIASIQVQPDDATVAVGADLPLTARVSDAQGNEITGQTIHWATEDATVAAVSDAGVVTGMSVGTVLISASTRGRNAFARVEVNPTPVASVRLSTTNRSMLVGETFQLGAETLDARGGVLIGRLVTWETSNAAVATVTAGGLVTAVAAGGAIITAQCEGRSATTSITVSPVPVASLAVMPDSAALVVGQTTQLTALVLDDTGAPLGGRAVSWTTSSAQVATVTSTGLVTAVAAGAVTITASSEGKSATARITVSPRPAAAVIVSPGQVTITVGQTAQLTVQVTDDNGTPLTGRSVTFTSSSAQVATVSGSGLVTGIAPGSATITATSGSASGSAAVTVSAVPVASVSISPSPASVIVGHQLQLTATPLSATGQPLTGRSVSWTSGAPGLASVSSTGVVTGLAVGDAVILATVEGVVGSVTVTVVPEPIASVTVSPPSASILVGQTVTLSAIVLDGSGNTVSGATIAWSSSDNAVATVSSGGVVTGVAAGSVTITATSGGVSGSATVTVTVPPVAIVAVTPQDVVTNVGVVFQLTATLYDAQNNVLTGRLVTWSTSDPTVVAVDATGLAVGLRKGTATITATSEGKSGSTKVTVK